MIKNISIIPTIIERRNAINFALDKNLIFFLQECFPKSDLQILTNVKKFQNKPNLIVSAGGNTIVSIKKGRTNKFRKVLDDYFFNYAIKNNVPFFGICHGAQYVANYFGSKITKIKNHTKKDHVILFKNEFKNIKVNSYHNYGIIKLGKQLNMIAYTKDSSIEAFKHNNKQILGIMWHPERYKKIRKFDIQFLKKYL